MGKNNDVQEDFTSIDIDQILQSEYDFDVPLTVRPERKALPNPPIPVPRKQVVRRHDDWRLDNSLFTQRVVAGLTQTELGRRIGVTRQTISVIETHRHEPVLSLGMALAEALNTTVEEIFTLRRPKFGGYDRYRR